MVTIEVAKRSFFDRPKVVSALDRAERKGLSRLGAFIRRRARSSLRKRKKSSPPGSPPSMHVGYIKKFLFFVYEAAKKTVVVGPALLSGAKGTPTVPELHEHSGETDQTEYQLSGGLWVSRNPDGSMRPVRLKRSHYPARPFMKPALDKELPMAPQHFKNTFIR